MKTEFPKIDQDKAIAPHAQEIEYALILSRLISTVQDDPAQMRSTIYEFARARLKLDTSWADEGERQRLTQALETAIQGVEAFSARRDDRERLGPPRATPLIGTAAAAAAAPALTMPYAVTPAPDDILPPERGYEPADIRSVLEPRTTSLVSRLVRFGIGMVLFGAVVALAYDKQSLPALRERLSFTQLNASGEAKPPAPPNAAQQAPASADAKPAAPPPPPFPLPSDYGVYALSNGALSELSVLS